MPRSSPQPARRTRLPRRSLTREVILDAAERVSADDVQGLTVRAVASELQSAPMALYRYFATKDELVDALLDRVLGRFDLEGETEYWLEDLRRFGHAHRQLLLRHPWAIAPLFSHPNPGLNAARIGEIALRILARGGITGESAVVTFSAVLALNYGWSAFASTRAAPPDDSGGTTNLGDVLAALPLDQYPLTVEVADHMSQYGSNRHYTLGLRQLLVGVEASAPTMG